MGLHYVNLPLVLDGELDATRPEIVIYEPLPNGRLRLIGADYLVLADAWHAKHAEPPQLMGQLLHLFEARTGSVCRRSTRCTSGRGRTTRAARSSTGTRTSPATRSTAASDTSRDDHVAAASESRRRDDSRWAEVSAVRINCYGSIASLW